MNVFDFAKVFLLLLGPVLLGAFTSMLLCKKTLAEMTDEIQELNQRLENANRLLSMQGNANKFKARYRSSAPAAAQEHLSGSPSGRSEAPAAGQSRPRVLRQVVILLLALTIVFFVVMVFSIYYIEPGFVGLKKREGRYLMDEAMPGPHFKIPFWQPIDEFDVRLKYVHFGNTADSSDPLTINSQPIKVKDADGIEAAIEMGLEYRIEPDMAAETVSKYGTDLTANLVRPAVTDALRRAFSHYSVRRFKEHDVLRMLPSAVSEAVSSLQEEGIRIYAIEFKSVSAPKRAAKEIKRNKSVQAEAVQPRLQPQKVDHPVVSGQEQAVPAASPPPGKSEKKDHGLEVEIYFCKDFERSDGQTRRLEYNLIGRSDRFSKGVGKIICFTRIMGAAEDTVIKHRWFWENKLVGEVPLAVRSKDWRTYSEFTVPAQRVGTWRVDVTQKDDILIGRKSFVVE
jgi:regulator of protease activity HflC (stomatin/prohibitin superfamily)